MSPLAQSCTKIECAWKSSSFRVFRETNGISWLRMGNIPLGISVITLPLSLFVVVRSGVVYIIVYIDQFVYYHFHMRQTHPPNHRCGRWRNILWYEIMKIQGIPVTKYFRAHAQFLPAAALHQVYGTRPWTPHMFSQVYLLCSHFSFMLLKSLKHFETFLFKTL